jgi:lipoprotein-anchoring transpeptidase ErfK/SrfK
VKNLDKKILLFIVFGLVFATPGLMAKLANWQDLQNKTNELKASPVVLQANVNNPVVTIVSQQPVTQPTQTQTQAQTQALHDAAASTPDGAIQTNSPTLPATTPPTIDCNFTKPTKSVYSAKLVSIQKKPVVGPGEAFQTEIYMENTGNAPWFSENSGCENVNVTYLGTTHEKDRTSPFSADGSLWDSHWVSGNRIKMDASRIDPKGMAKFTFWSRAPQEMGYYREFFAPVIEGVSWINNEEATVAMDIRVGEFELTPEQTQYLPYIELSTNLSKLDFSGEKKIEVSLKQQKMWLKIGDITISSFVVSTGAYKTPTPKGTTKIILKQNVRVAGSRPHYIMPLFMMFRSGGFGFHALPSLANDKGVFWREALDHIGTPRSHGCIRLLPEDAKVVFNFADIGTKVEVRA